MTLSVCHAIIVLTSVGGFLCMSLGLWSILEEDMLAD